MPAPANQRQPEAQALQSRDAPVLTLRAAVVPATIDEKTRSVEVVWSTGAEVDRYDWRAGKPYKEVLSMAPAHVRMDRLNNGAPLLDSHGMWSASNVLGVVESARIADGKGIARVRFSDRAAVEPIWNDVRTGILRHISVGYAVHKWQIERSEDQIEKRTALDWEPYELSIVPMPADPGAQVRAYNDDAPGSVPEQAGHARASDGQEITRMADPVNTPTPKPGNEPAPSNTQTPAPEGTRAAPAPVVPAPATAPVPALDERGAERQRCAEIVELCRMHGVPDERRSAWLSEGVAVDAVRSAILTSIGERQRAQHVSPITHAGADTDRAMRRDATDALLRRSGMQVEGDGHRQFNDAHLVDMARRFLERGGVNTSSMSRLDLATRALSTSDFAAVLYLVGEKTMRAGYDSVPLVHRQVLRRGSASDFRPKNTVAVDAGDLLVEVPEGGPIPQKKARYENGSYKIKSYGKIVAFTRQMLIDDDIDALTVVSQSRGRAAAETERKVVWDFILANPNAPDGQTVFHKAAHGNYPDAAGATVSTGEIDLANSFFRTAQSLSGIPINASLRTIVASDTSELALQRLLYGGYLPSSSATGVTERDRRIQVLCEPMVGGTGNKQHWLGFADPNQASSFEFAYLSGTADGVRLEQKAGFEIEGLQLKVCLEFGIGVLDWRGVYYRRQS